MHAIAGAWLALLLDAGACAVPSRQQLKAQAPVPPVLVCHLTFVV
jgi:hypothetical protein